jgi:hypothetical protein
MSDTKKYRVRLLLDDIYQVRETETKKTVHQGTLAECEAWIRLKEGGYL